MPKLINIRGANSLQSFSIPGSMWLSVLGGALFNFWLTLFTVSLVMDEACFRPKGMDGV